MTTSSDHPVPKKDIFFQLQPDYLYSIYLGTDTSAAKLADVFVVDAGHTITLVNAEKYTRACTGDSTTGGTEYWWYSNDSLNGNVKMDSLTGIYLDVIDLKDGTSYNFSWDHLIAKTSRVIKPAGEGWSTTRKQYTGGKSYFFSSSTWGLELNIGTDSASGKLFLNGVQWYQPGTTRPLPIGGNAFKGGWNKVSPFPDTYLAESSI